MKQTSLNVPASVASIGKGAFYGCTRLSAATLPDGSAVTGATVSSKAVTAGVNAVLDVIDVPA